MPNGTNGKPADFVTFSEPNPATILQYSAPLIALSAAGNELPAKRGHPARLGDR